MPDPVAPLIKVDETGKIRILHVKCPYCNKVHKHGGDYVINPPLLGHRGRHCSSNDGKGNGYYIVKI